MAWSESERLDQGHRVVIYGFHWDDRGAWRFALTLPAMVISNAAVTVAKTSDLRVEHSPVAQHAVGEHNWFWSGSLFLDTKSYPVDHDVAN